MLPSTEPATAVTPAPAALPEFPWDRLAPYAARARRHPGGLVDLSVGTPVDPTPALAQQALAAAADAPGYPPAAGTPPFLAAARAWLARRCGAPEHVGVLPVVGTKEVVALLPSLLGVRGTVRIPDLAYPTYEVGARLAGLPVVRASQAPVGPGLVWLNSPGNPTGEVLSAPALAAQVAAARAAGAVVASDECYLDFGDTVEPVSVLDPAVHGGDLTGVLALHSLSKRSNLAGYRAGVLAGDPALVARVLEVRRHAGLLVPAPVQAAAAAVLDDEAHVHLQRRRYAARRAVLVPALARAGFRVDHSGAGLYLWATRGEDCWASVAALAELGILAAPGVFYGPTGAGHVRLALTATDERVAAAADRLGAAGQPATAR